MRRGPVLGGLGAAAAAWEARRRADVRAIRNDPLHARLQDWPEGEPTEVTGPDGTRLHAEVHGPPDGPTVVLTHGWTCSSAFWTLQVRDLVADGARVVTWDLRGHGRSDRPASGDYDVERFAEDLAAVVQATVPDGRRALLAGHSLGAMTTVALAGEAPEVVRDHVAAVALLNTGVGDLVTESLVVRAPARLKPLLGRVVLQARTPLPKRSTPISHRVVRHVALCKAAPPAAIDFTERLSMDCRPDVRGSVGGALSRLELRDSLAHLDVPALVLAGADDHLTPPVHAERMAEALPQVVELCVLEHTGHMAPIERDGEVTSRLRALVRDHVEGRARTAVPSGA